MGAANLREPQSQPIPFLPLQSGGERELVSTMFHFFVIIGKGFKFDHPNANPA
jgi:hypothetical protein